MPNTYSVEYNGERTTFNSMEEAERHIREDLGRDTYSIEDRRDYGLAGGERVSGVRMGEGERLLNEARPLDSTGNRFMGFGYYDPAAREWVPPGRDMVDGGGAGRSGDTFQGGPFSGMLNAMGVRPAGYRERLENNMAPTQSLRPRARPSQGIFSAYTPGAGYTPQPLVESAVTPASAGNTSAAQNYGVTLPVTGPIPVEASVLPSTDPFMQMLENAVNPPSIPTPAARGPLNFDPSAYGSIFASPPQPDSVAGLNISMQELQPDVAYTAPQLSAGIGMSSAPVVPKAITLPGEGQFERTWLGERLGVEPLNIRPGSQRNFYDAIQDDTGSWYQRLFN